MNGLDKCPSLVPPNNEPLLSASPAWLVRAGLLCTPNTGLMKFWSLLSQYYDIWSLWSNSSFSFKCAFFAAPSPSTPRRIMFIWLLICKTTKKIVVERNSCFSCVWNSMLQCSATPRKSPGSKGKIGRSPVAIIQCTLHCHHTPLLFLICNPSVWIIIKFVTWDLRS